MRNPTQIVSAALVSMLALGLTGCPFKKKHPEVPPPAAQAPTAPAPEPTPTPVAPPAPTPTPSPTPTPEATAKPKPKPKHPKKPAEPASAQQKPEPKPEEKPQQQASAKPPRIVIQEGSTSASQGEVTSPIAHDEATHRRLTTAQLLQSTEDNLRGLKPPLTADQQATVAQIRDYMEQSRTATNQDDVVRAHNLALKAHLLSDVLANK